MPINNPLGNDKVRFLIAGGSAAGINWLARFPLNHFFPFEIAVTFAMIIGMIFGFIFYRNWVFPNTTNPMWRQASNFITINLLGMAITVAGAIAAQHFLLQFNFQEPLAAAVGHAAGIASGAIANYIGHKHFTFKT